MALQGSFLRQGPLPPWGIEAEGLGPVLKARVEHWKYITRSVTGYCFGPRPIDCGAMFLIEQISVQSFSLELSGRWSY